MRGVSVIFNVYVSNRAGSEAMGLYSLLGSVYSFAITLATAGINLGTTRLVSEALGRGDIAQARRSAKRALLYCLLTGSIATVLLFTLAPVIGSSVLGDLRAVTPLRCLAVTLIPVAVCSCLSGYFTGVRRVKVNAAFQVVTQFSKIGATVFLLSLLVERGTEMACIALVLGGAVSELLSLLVSYILYRIDLKKMLTGNGQENGTSKPITGALLAITLPVTFSACIRSLLSMLQHVLIPRCLTASGASWSEALSSYGALHGMALPVILFPSAFISAFAGLLIPEVSEYCVQQNSARLKRVSYRALTFSLIFSIGVSGIMLFFSEQLGSVIYHNSETALYIRVLAPLIPVMYIDSAVDAILKGSGHQVYSMNVNIADVLAACILVVALIPSLGIWGYVISIYVTEILNTTLSLCKMISVSGIKVKILHQIAMPILCIIGATNGVKLILSLTSHPFGQVTELILHVVLTTLVYLILLLVTNTIGKDEKEVISASLLLKSASQRREKIIQQYKNENPAG